MKPKPTLSLIVYGWRSIPELAAAVDSVLAQAPSSIEILVPVPAAKCSEVDRAIVASGLDVRVVPARTEREATSLNAAVLHARGRFVAFLRAGAPWISRVAHEHAAFLDEHAECHVLASDWTADGLPAEREMTLLTLIERTQTLRLHGAIFRRDVLVEAGMFDEGIRERYDAELWLRLARRGARIVARQSPALMTTMTTMTTTATTAGASGGRVGHDRVNDLEAIISVLERFAHRHLMDPSLRTALRVKIMALIDRLEIEQAKCRMLEGHADAACYHLSSTRAPSWQVRVAITLLRLTPRLATTFYRRVPAFTAFL